MNKTLDDYIPELNDMDMDIDMDIVFDNTDTIDMGSKKNENIKKDINPLDIKKKFIIDTIKRFCKFEQIEIFKIFKKHNIKYTENNNGIFINLNIISESILDEIELFINFCITKKKCLQVEKTKRENLAKLIKDDNNYSSNNNISNHKFTFPYKALKLALL